MIELHHLSRLALGLIGLVEGVLAGLLVEELRSSDIKGEEDFLVGIRFLVLFLVPFLRD
jgi:hypothetical protein